MCQAPAYNVSTRTVVPEWKERIKPQLTFLVEDLCIEYTAVEAA